MIKARDELYFYHGMTLLDKLVLTAPKFFYFNIKKYQGDRPVVQHDF